MNIVSESHSGGQFFMINIYCSKTCEVNFYKDMRAFFWHELYWIDQKY